MDTIRNTLDGYLSAYGLLSDSRLKNILDTWDTLHPVQQKKFQEDMNHFFGSDAVNKFNEFNQAQVFTESDKDMVVTCLNKVDSLKTRFESVGIQIPGDLRSYMNEILYNLHVVKDRSLWSINIPYR